MSLVYLKLFLMSIFWGGNFIAGKFITAELSPVTSNFLRYFMASLFLILLISKKYGKLPRLNTKQFLLIICLSLSGIVGFGLFFFWGLKYISASRAAIIISLNPILITIFSAFVLKDKITFAKFAGIIISITGAVIVISKGNLADVLSNKIGYGELILLVAVVLWAIFSVLGKITMNYLEPVISVAYATIAGAIILFFLALSTGELSHFMDYSLTVWVSAFFMGVFGTSLAFIWFYEGIDKIGPPRAGIFINFMPIFATLLAVLILGEQLYSSLILGAILVISGVYLTNYGNQKNKNVVELES